jgi:hypothetical protein
MFDFAVWAVAPVSVEASYRSHMHPPASQLRRRPTHPFCIDRRSASILLYSIYDIHPTGALALKDAATPKVHTVRGWTIAQACHKSEM